MENWLDSSTATWEECRDYLALHPCAILPMGATEQHGPHLPQNTDTLLAEAVARRVAEGSHGLLLPASPVGYSWVWRDYPGSLSFSFDTLRAVVKDLARSLDRNGCRAFLILHGHGANPNPVKYALRELADEMDLRILQVFYPHLDQLRGEVESEMWGGGNFHAEEVETSMMLFLHPDLVRMDRAVREYPDLSVEYEMSSLPMGALSQSGVFGDATVATMEKGERFLQLWVERTVELWAEFLGSG
jgi:creatinine amidohydrolase